MRFLFESGFVQKFQRVRIVREGTFALRAIPRFMPIFRRFHPANRDIEPGDAVPPAAEALT